VCVKLAYSFWVYRRNEKGVNDTFFATCSGRTMAAVTISSEMAREMQYGKQYEQLAKTSIILSSQLNNVKPSQNNLSQ
jgi:hypothetical protein